MLVRSVAGFAAGVAVGYGIYRVLFKKNEVKKVEEKPEDFCAIFVVRKDLKMRQGKIAAQCGHASLGIFQKVVKHMPFIAEQWLEKKFPKVFYFCQNEDVMNAMEHSGRQKGYLTLIIHDAGRTQIAAGSATVLAIGPVKKDDVADVIEGHNLVAIP